MGIPHRPLNARHSFSFNYDHYAAVLLFKIQVWTGLKFRIIMTAAVFASQIIN